MKTILLLFSSCGLLSAQWWVTGYYVDNTGVESVAQIPFQYYTHVIAFAAFPGTTGGAGDGSVDTSELPNLAAIPTAAHAAGKKAILCIRGNNSFGSAFSQSTAPGLLATFVTNILSTANSNGYDGVDLDWENPTLAGDPAQYGSLITSLRASIPAGKTISMAAGNFNNLQTVAGNNYMNLDQINIECYDMDGGPAGGPSVDQTWYNDALLIGSSSISGCDWRVAAFLSTGVPYSKMGIGMPFYGRTWSGFTAALQSDPGGHGVTVLYKDLQAQANFIPANLFYDLTFQSDYLSTSSPAVWTSYTGARTMQDIVAYRKAHNFGGYMTFALHYEFVSTAPTTPGKYPLSSALAALLANPTLTSGKAVIGGKTIVP